MHKIRILLAEEDVRMAMLIADMLEGSDYQVIIASNGQVAHKYLNEADHADTPYHIVITEVMLCGSNGMDLLRAARRQQPPAEVIMLTGFGTISSAIDALRAGAYDYLLKPCKAAQLLSCVGSAIEQLRRSRWQNEALKHIAEGGQIVHASVLTNEGAAFTPSPSTSQMRNIDPDDSYLHEGLLRLDRRDYVAFFDDREIALTPTEYALLYCLLDAQGQMLSYQEIARHTHGYATSNAEAQTLLKTHISHLRRKIDPSYLVNVRGVGYMLTSAHIPETAA